MCGKWRPFCLSLNVLMGECLHVVISLFIYIFFQANIWRYGDITEDDAKEFGYQ